MRLLLASLVILLSCFGCAATNPAKAPTGPTLPQTESAWKKSLAKKIAELDAEYAGQFGLVVMNLKTGEEYSFRGGEKWYVASGTKLIVAIEVFKQIEKGSLTLEGEVKLTKDDLVDGGKLNISKVDSAFTVAYLLEQTLIYSDNTATDMLVRTVGLERVNTLGKTYGFNNITTLAEVRRRIYEKIHPKARELTGEDLVKLGALLNDTEKTKLLETMLDLPLSKWRVPSIQQAYIGYYAEGANTASLKAYSRLLSRLVAGDVLKANSTEQILGLMGRANTGDMRIKRGLSVDLAYAYKTGTQRRRLCDFGVIRRDGVNLAVVSACARGFALRADGEKVLARIGEALSQSGLLLAEKVEP